MTSKALIVAVIACAMGAGALAAPASAQSVTFAPAPSEDLTRLQERVSELEQLLRQATGENERLAIELRRTRNENARLERMMNDAMAQQQAGIDAAAQPLTQTPADPAVAARSTARPTPSTTTVTPNASATGSLGTLPADAAGDSASALKNAMRLLQLGRFPEAEAAFTGYVQANPRSPDAPEARYFIGRTQVAQRRFPDAADTFVNLLRDHPAIARAPDSWVALGVSLNGMGKKTEACGVFRDLATKYPRASAATRQSAAVEARNAQCTAR